MYYCLNVKFCLKCINVLLLIFLYFIVCVIAATSQMVSQLNFFFDAFLLKFAQMIQIV